MAAQTRTGANVGLLRRWVLGRHVPPGSGWNSPGREESGTALRPGGASSPGATRSKARAAGTRWCRLDVRTDLPSLAELRSALRRPAPDGFEARARRPGGLAMREKIGGRRTYDMPAGGMAAGRRRLMMERARRAIQRFPDPAARCAIRAFPSR